MPTEISHSSSLLDHLVQHVYITNLSIGWPRLRLTINGAVVEVGNGEVVAEKYRTNPKWDLMPTKWRKKFQAIDSKARSVISKRSLRFTTPAMAMLPIIHAERVFESLSTLRNAFFDSADEFAAAFPQIREDLKDKIASEVDKTVAASVFAKIPETAESIRRRFVFTWAIVPIGYNNLSDENVNKLLSARAAASAAGATEAVEKIDAVLESASKAIRDVTVNEAQELTKAAKRQMEAYASRLVDTIAEEPRKKLIEAATHLREAVNTGKSIRNGSLDRIREAVSLLEGFQFLQNDQLLREAHQLRTYLSDIDATSVNSADEELAGAINDIIDRVVDVANDTANAAAAKRRFINLQIG